MNDFEPPIGILGGTFDPVHLGHIYLSLEILKATPVQLIKFLPCYQPVHRTLPLSNAKDRVAMIKIAIEDQPQMKLDTREIDREGPSYMIDTLISLRDELPTTPLCLILGQDAFNYIDTWKRWRELISYAHILVVNRSHTVLKINQEVLTLFPQPQGNTKEILCNNLAGSLLIVNFDPINISATEIRSKIKANLSVADLLPEGVITYIQNHQLYR